MSETSLLNPSAAVAQVETAPTLVRDRRMRWFELALVLSVAFAQPILTALDIFVRGNHEAYPRSPFGWVAATLWHIPPLFVLAYVLRRNGRTFRDIGFRWSLKDFGVGVLLFIVALFAAAAAGIALKHITLAFGYDATAAMHATRSYWAPGTFTKLWSVSYLFLVPFYEELMVRAYMMTEIIELTGSRVLAIASSVALQGSYHLYYGWYGALLVSFYFVVFALYFAKARKALPCVTAHWLLDLVATLLKR